MDDSELLGLLSRPADWKRVVVLASEIREWRKEAPTIRLIVGGPPSRTVWFSIRGIRPADRERIVAWLTEKKGP
jgi:hypothetical protein